MPTITVSQTNKDRLGVFRTGAANMNSYDEALGFVLNAYDGAHHAATMPIHANLIIPLDYQNGGARQYASEPRVTEIWRASVEQILGWYAHAAAALMDVVLTVIRSPHPSTALGMSYDASGIVSMDGTYEDSMWRELASVGFPTSGAPARYWSWVIGGEGWYGSRPSDGDDRAASWIGDALIRMEARGSLSVPACGGGGAKTEPVHLVDGGAGHETSISMGIDPVDHLNLSTFSPLTPDMVTLLKSASAKFVRVAA